MPVWSRFNRLASCCVVPFDERLMASSDARTTSKARDDDNFTYSSALIGRAGGLTIVGGAGLGEGAGASRDAQPASNQQAIPPAASRPCAASFIVLPLTCLTCFPASPPDRRFPRRRARAPAPLLSASGHSCGRALRWWRHCHNRFRARGL